MARSVADPSTSYRATWASRGNVLLPTDINRIPDGVWLYGSTGIRGLLANQVTGWLTAQGIRYVPGSNVGWIPPIDPILFLEWLQVVETELQTNVASWVVLLPADRRRRRFSLLLLDRKQRPAAFVKLTVNEPNPLALAALARFGKEMPEQFWAPSLVLNGQVDQYSYVVTSVAPSQSHGPARLTPARRHSIVEELQTRLAPLVSTAAVVVHGDFAPWNVRQLKSGRIAVLDWEETTEGVAAADELWYAVTVHARGRSSSLTAMRDVIGVSFYTKEEVSAAAKFWLERLGGSQPGEVDTSVAMPERLSRYSRKIQTLLEELAS